MFFQKRQEPIAKEELEQFEYSTFNYFIEYLQIIAELLDNSNEQIPPNVVLSTLLLKYSESSSLLNKNEDICDMLKATISSNSQFDLSWLDVLERHLETKNLNKGRFYGLMVTFFYYYADLVPVNFNDYLNINKNFIAINQYITQVIEVTFVKAIICRASDYTWLENIRNFNNVSLSTIKISNEQQEKKLIDYITSRLQFVENCTSNYNIPQEDITQYCTLILEKLWPEVSQSNKRHLIKIKDVGNSPSLRRLAWLMISVPKINSLNTSNDINKLQTLLSDTTAQTKRTRIDAFGNLGKLKDTNEEEQLEIIKASIHATTDSDAEVRSAAKNTLCEMKISEINLQKLIWKFIKKAKNAPHTYIQLDAIYILGSLKYGVVPNEVVMTLGNIYEDNRQDIVKATIESLTKLLPLIDLNEQVIKQLINSLMTIIVDGLNPSNKCAAIRFIREMFPKASRDIQTNIKLILDKLISDQSHDVCMHALVALGRLNLNITLLLTNAKNSSDKIRKGALLGLSYLQDPEKYRGSIIQALVKGTWDINTDVQKTAYESLERFAKKQSMIIIAALIIKLEQIVLMDNSKLELKINFKPLIDELKNSVKQISFENKIGQWKQLANSAEKQFSKQNISGSNGDFGVEAEEIPLTTINSFSKS